jgi:putative MATE family efflux protein
MSNYVQTTPEQVFDNSFWSILKEAVRGSTRDFTQGSIGLAIFLLSVPMVLEMVMESIFAIVDIFFVARLGADAVAVVGITESMLAIIYAFAIGLGIGATATVARRIGEKDEDGAARSATHALYLGLIVSVILSTIGIIFAADFLALLGASEKVVAEGTLFAQIMLGGNFVIVFLFLLNSIFRGAGDAAIAMRVLWMANIINIVLDPILIFGWWIFPELGVTGAAVATVVGRGIGVLFAFWYLFRGEKRFQIRAEHWRLDPSLLWKLVKVSSTAVLQFTIGTASWVGLMVVVAGFGSEAVAGYTIGIRIIIFALLPSVGMSNAAATLVGQNLGAKKPERAEKSVWKTAVYNAIFSDKHRYFVRYFRKSDYRIFHH